MSDMGRSRSIAADASAEYWNLWHSWNEGSKLCGAKCGPLVISGVEIGHEGYWLPSEVVCQECSYSYVRYRLIRDCQDGETRGQG